MSNNIRVLVVGATGAQGGSVARHLLGTGRYKVRCLTRHPDSSSAMALRQAGAEIVQGDLEDPPALRALLRDCDAVFGVTNYWEHGEREYVQGRNLVDAIRHSDVQHTILSTLPHTKLLSGGRLEVPHFDTKARIEEYAREMELPATYLHVAFYYENFLNYFPPRRQPDGTYVFGFPQGTTPLAAIAASDIGGLVVAILAESFWYRDKLVGAVGDDLRADEYAEVMTQTLHRKVEYHYIDHASFAALPFPAAPDLANMFEFNRLYVPNRRADLAKSRELFPEIRSFDRWLRSNTTAMQHALDS
ncbi:uncharacterized protein YbjT (DUF2867 family) [Povalibacter uvarum]|uniref:Uncharacterized protein YbjT (DUF2867 family) n=1 Tax=Povalibacter uvarum TaxID=732238 RepID=A0A841HR61_9GAMM|nr:NmrA/HSCARG family protein [Povalibacter uvarum]MBB6094578.1 uncharacterized protein YbjT (DUF2867 family) [Povalibacter uvarum]